MAVAAGDLSPAQLLPLLRGRLFCVLLNLDPKGNPLFCTGSSVCGQIVWTCSGQALMLIIQRFDVARGMWVDEICRHALWAAHKTVRARSLVTGRDYRIISAHSRRVLDTVLAANHGSCCPLPGSPFSCPSSGQGAV